MISDGISLVFAFEFDQMCASFADMTKFSIGLRNLVMKNRETVIDNFWQSLWETCILHEGQLALALHRKNMGKLRKESL